MWHTTTNVGTPLGVKVRVLVRVTEGVRKSRNNGKDRSKGKTRRLQVGAVKVVCVRASLWVEVATGAATGVELGVRAEVRVRA